MKPKMAAALFCSVALSAGAAHAQTYTVDKVTITGSKTVPTADLLAAIQEHKGSKVTKDEIIADQDAITNVLHKANVVGGIKTSMASKPGNHIEVVFALDDQGAQAPVITKVAPKLHAETFAGNVFESTANLQAAAALNPGDSLSNDKIAAAQKALVALYAAAKAPVSVSVGVDFKTVSPGLVDVVWTIVETKAKKKRRNTEDEGGQKLEQ